MSESYTFRGRVTYERYFNEESFWGVYTVQTKEQLPYSKPIKPFESEDNTDIYVISVAGKVQQLYVGSEYTFVAHPEYKEKYQSWSYVPSSVTAIAPKSVAESRLFLESVLTPTQADTLLKVYPNIVHEIINHTDNVDVSKLHGIGKTTWSKIKEKIINNYVISDIITLLQPLGVTYNAVKSLLKYEPNPTILKQKIKENPYVLTNAKGFGFLTVDRMALKLDPSLINSGKRLAAFIKYYLYKAANDDGHTWVLFNVLRNNVLDSVPQCAELFDKLVNVENGTAFGSNFYVENNRIGLHHFKDCEESIYNILMELNLYPFNGVVDTEHGISRAEEKLGYALTEEQRTAVKNIEASNVILITGKAGTGKSTSARAILESLAGSSIACCSLSAKAAQRIMEATGFNAMTIHRLLGYNGVAFAYNSENRLPYDVVFIDEASMINCQIFYCLLSAIKEGAKVIICGDYAQLPPIGAGNIFSDILQMNDRFSVSLLTKVQRQAERSGILTDANKIREGIFPIKAPEPQIVTGELQDMAYVFRNERERLQEIAIKQYIKMYNQHGVENVAVAVPRKDTVINSALEINKKIQEVVINTENTPYLSASSNRFYIGDRVIQIENDARRNIYNGEVGFVENVFPEAKANEVCLIARFVGGEETKYIEYKYEDLHTLQLGYALSIHKMQGSEYDYVIVVIDNTHYTLLDNCLLYTGITRAKKLCVLVAEPQAFNKAMKTNFNANRQTWLKYKYIDGELGDG